MFITNSSLRLVRFVCVCVFAPLFPRVAELSAMTPGAEIHRLAEAVHASHWKYIVSQSFWPRRLETDVIFFCHHGASLEACHCNTAGYYVYVCFVLERVCVYVSQNTSKLIIIII